MWIKKEKYFKILDRLDDLNRDLMLHKQHIETLNKRISNLVYDYGELIEFLNIKRTFKDLGNGEKKIFLEHKNPKYYEPW